MVLTSENEEMIKYRSIFKHRAIFKHRSILKQLLLEVTFLTLAQNKLTAKCFH